MCQEEKLYTIKEVAEILRVDYRTVLRWCKERKIDYFDMKLGKFYIAQKDLNAMLAQAKVKKKVKLDIK